MLQGATSPEVVFWSQPSSVETVDFSVAPGGPEKSPKPPFTYIREDFGGTSPKIVVKDATGIEWRVKGGREVRAETFVTRFVSALGYYTDVMYFLAEGRVEGLGRLQRASGFVQPDGRFTYASFERREPGLRFSDRHTWTWKSSPFRGRPELQGLKILMMLFSNWDNKDARDARRGSNTGVLESLDGRKAIYYVNDWGQSLGGWGRFVGRTQWDCVKYAEQTSVFVTRVTNPFVRFGYGGQHTVGFSDDIRVNDVRWLMQFLGRISDSQIRVGLLASGATKDEEQCFTSAIRKRIEQLRVVLEPR